MTAATTEDRAELIEKAVERIEEARERVVRAAEASVRACIALVGLEAGPGLDERVAALRPLTEAEHAAVKEYWTAKAALAAMEGEG